MSKTMLAAWRRGGRVWISRRLMQPKPSPAWWIEGDDSRVRWADVFAFYGSLEYANPAGGEDGFLELQPSPSNETRLQQTADLR